MGAYPFDFTPYHDGEVIISEAMVKPVATFSYAQEYLELYNPTDQPVWLYNWGISGTSFGGASYFEYMNNPDLYILPGDYFVIGRNVDIESNGGYTSDYVYSEEQVGFGNGSDIIQIYDYNENLNTSFAYNSSDFTIVTGRSMEMIHLDSDNLYSPDNWSISVYNYGTDGLYGTPGGDNSTLDNLPVADAGGPYIVTDSDDDLVEDVNLDFSDSEGSIDNIVDYFISINDMIEGGVVFEGYSGSTIATVNLPVGHYNLTLTVTDESGLSDSDQTTIAVNNRIPNLVINEIMITTTAAGIPGEYTEYICILIRNACCCITGAASNLVTVVFTGPSIPSKGL